MPVLDPERLIIDRVNAIRNYHNNAGIEKAQLDVSGGVDSAVMLGLLSRALGHHNVIAVYSGINSSEDSLRRAREAADAFDVALIEIDLTPEFTLLATKMHESMKAAGYHIPTVIERKKNDPTVMGSIRSTLRAPIGRGFNRLLGGGIRHGTGNECEDRWLRFYQKGGDGEVDTNPIAMLSKGEVYQLGVALGVPQSILNAVPSPDLHSNGASHNDEDELKALYGVDWTYSKVNAQGEYTYVGTIERMSRLLDHGKATATLATYMRHRPEHKSDSVATVQKYFPENEFTWEDIEAMVDSAYAIDAATKHKENPNCPTLGSREPLIWDGILTNELPCI